MGIRSLLRNAFGRSKAAREQSGAARNGAERAPESATIPEAREESAPGAAPDPEVPAARTAPAEVPATAALPAQGSPVDEKAEAAPSVREEVTLDEEPAAADKPGEADAVVVADAVVEPDAVVVADGAAVADDAPATESIATSEPTAAEPAEPAVESKAAGPAEPAAAVDSAETEAPSDDISALVSEAFDNPKPQPATEAKAEPEPEAESAPEAAAEPAPEATPEPEATREPEPQAQAEEPQAPAEQAAEEQAAEDATAKDAAPEDATAPLSLAKVETTAPALVSLYKSASATLAKHNLATQRAAVYLVLDRSGSMRNYYKDGTVQNLAEQALGLSANLDDDGTVPVIFFSTDVDGTADIDLTNYAGRIEELHAGLGHMGRTNYHWAINAVVEHYKKSGSTAPAFVIFQTDGAPTSKPAAEKALCEAAELPIFWQFVGFGDPDAKGFDFLRKLDDLAVPEKRVVDNAGFFHAGRDPRSLSADELYGQLMVEFPEWLTEARTAGVLKDN